MAAIDLLEVTEEALAFAGDLVADGVIPAASAADALHIGIAVTAGCDYGKRRCRSHGYEPLVICTPEELMEDD